MRWSVRHDGVLGINSAKVDVEGEEVDGIKASNGDACLKLRRHINYR